MTPIDPTIRQELLDVVVRYATAIDDRDWALLRTCFTDDCKSDYGVVGQWSSGDEITDFMEQVHAECGHTIHWIGNHAARQTEDGYAARTYVNAVVMRGDNRKGLEMRGYYDDEFVANGEGWRIARRTFTPTVTTRVVSWPES